LYASVVLLTLNFYLSAYPLESKLIL